MTIALFALWGAVVWRMRGGAFAEATGINIGTQATRAACGLLLALPLAILARDPWLLLIAPAVFVGLVICGWAPFMAYGLDGNAHVEASPFDWLPRTLGVPQASEMTDFAAWMQIGLVCMLPSEIALWWLGFAWWWLAVPAVAFSGVYWACDRAGSRRWLPYFRVIDTPEAWAELVMGAVIGAALAMAIGV